MEDFDFGLNLSTFRRRLFENSDEVATEEGGWRVDDEGGGEDGRMGVSAGTEEAVSQSQVIAGWRNHVR